MERSAGRGVNVKWGIMVDALEPRRLLAGATLLINCGGSAFTDGGGQVWAADSGFTGGTAIHATFAVAGTTDDALYYNERTGAFTYSIAAANGSYSLTLYFAEPAMTKAGQRKFNVFAEGKTLLSSFDVFAAGGAKTAVTRTFSISIADGKLDLQFQNVVSNSILSAIRLLPAATAPAIPANLAAVPLTPASNRLTWTESSTGASSFLIERADAAIGTFTQVGSVAGSTLSFVDGNLPSATSYLYRVRAANSAGMSGYSAQTAVTTLSPLPSPWTDADIGSIGVGGGAGASAASNGSLIVNGSGADIWNSADAFHFAYQQQSSDIDIIARVTGELPTDPWAKAGVMIRQSLAANSAWASMIITPGKGALFQRRLTTGTSALGVTSLSAKAPAWVRLTRVGNVFTGYLSTDGSNWMIAGSDTLSLPAGVYVGLCVCAHNASLLNSATFDSISITAKPASTFEWSRAADAPVTRFESPNAVVDGKLYVFGGFIDTALDASARTDVFDPFQNTWTQMADMPLAVTHAGVAVVGTDIYLAGGFVGAWPGLVTDQVMKYDTLTNSWTIMTSLPAPRAAGGLVFLGNHLHFFGGLNAARTADMEDHWMFDLTNPAAGWTPLAPLPDARDHFGFIDFDGMAYAIGGEHLLNEDHGNDAEVDAYDPAQDAWLPVQPLPVARSHNHTSTFMVKGRIVIIGGQADGPSQAITLADVLSYDPNTNQWIALPPVPAPVQAIAAKAIGNLVIITGGADQNHLPQAGTWLGDFTDLWPAVSVPIVPPSPIIWSGITTIGENTDRFRLVERDSLVAQIAQLS